MILYSENGKKIDFDITNANLVKNGDRGFGSCVYHYGSNCLKIFRILRDCDDEVIEAIRNIDCANLYKILHLYYSSILRSNENFVAYSSLYYEDFDINILKMPMDYLLDNFSDLRKLAIILANAGVEINDLHSENIIMQKNRIIIIDSDKYILHHNLNDDLLNYIKWNNIFSIRLLMGDILCDTMSNDLNFNKCNDTSIMKELDVFFDNYNYSIDDIFHELSCYKDPIDYVRKKHNY